MPDVPLDGNILLKKGIGEGWYIKNALKQEINEHRESLLPLPSKGASSSTSLLGGLAVPSTVLSREEEAGWTSWSTFRPLLEEDLTASPSYASSASKIWVLETRLLLALSILLIQCTAETIVIDPSMTKWYVKIRRREYNTPSTSFRDRGPRCCGGLSSSLPVESNGALSENWIASRSHSESIDLTLATVRHGDTALTRTSLCRRGRCETGQRTPHRAVVYE